MLWDRAGLVQIVTVEYGAHGVFCVRCFLVSDTTGCCVLTGWPLAKYSMALGKPLPSQMCIQKWTSQQPFFLDVVGGGRELT